MLSQFQYMLKSQSTGKLDFKQQLPKQQSHQINQQPILNQQLPLKSQKQQQVLKNSLYEGIQLESIYKRQALQAFDLPDLGNREIRKFQKSASQIVKQSKIEKTIYNKLRKQVKQRSKEGLDDLMNTLINNKQIRNSSTGRNDAQSNQKQILSERSRSILQNRDRKSKIIAEQEFKIESKQTPNPSLIQRDQPINTHKTLPISINETSLLNDIDKLQVPLIQIKSDVPFHNPTQPVTEVIPKYQTSTETPLKVQFQIIKPQSYSQPLSKPLSARLRQADPFEMEFKKHYKITPDEVNIKMLKLFENWIEGRKKQIRDKELSNQPQSQISQVYIHSLKDQYQKYYEAFVLLNRHNNVFEEGFLESHKQSLNQSESFTTRQKTLRFSKSQISFNKLPNNENIGSHDNKISNERITHSYELNFPEYLQQFPIIEYEIIIIAQSIKQYQLKLKNVN
eukprot:403359378